MFNIGMGELIFIVFLALVVVGPERLPKIMREFGRIVREIRIVVNQFTDQFGDELQTIQELQQPIQELQQLANDINPVKQVTKISLDLDASATESGAASSATPVQTGKPLTSPVTPQAGLVKPTAAFKTRSARTSTNPMKIIGRTKASGSATPSSSSDDS